MNPLFLLRLVLDFLAVGLFMVAMAYWWLDNRTHELVGTGMFTLLFLHNVFNRRWYARIPKTPRLPRSLLSVGLNLTLLLVMATLLVTSLLISQSLFEFTAIGGSAARDIHILAAYWALVILSIHLGMHWSIVMGIARRLPVVRKDSLVRTILLRVVVFCLAVEGVRSSFDLMVGSRLFLVPTMEFWDFSEGSAGFFSRCASVVCLYAAAGHYAMRGLSFVEKRWRPASGTASGKIRN